MSLRQELLGYPGARDEKVAHWISLVASPPVISFLSVGMVAYAAPQPGRWRWAALYVFLAIGLPMVYMLYLLLQNRIGDIHLNSRADRIGPLTVSILCTGGAGLLLYAGDAPALLTGLAVVNTVQLICFLAITLHWKISAHSSAIAGLSVLAMILAGPSAAAVSLSVPVVVWARVHLGSHTLSQTMAGLSLGALLMLPLLAL